MRRSLPFIALAAYLLSLLVFYRYGDERVDRWLSAYFLGQNLPLLLLALWIPGKSACRFNLVSSLSAIMYFLCASLFYLYTLIAGRFTYFTEHRLAGAILAFFILISVALGLLATRRKHG